MKNLREGQLARVDVEIVKSDPKSEMLFVREMITEDSKQLGESDEISIHQEALEEKCSRDSRQSYGEKSEETVHSVDHEHE